MPTNRFNPRANALRAFPAVGIFDTPLTSAGINSEWASWVAGAWDVLPEMEDEQSPDFANLIALWRHLRDT